MPGTAGASASASVASLTLTFSIRITFYLHIFTLAHIRFHVSYGRVCGWVCMEVYTVHTMYHCSHYCHPIYSGGLVVDLRLSIYFAKTNVKGYKSLFIRYMVYLDSVLVSQQAAVHPPH